MESQHWQKLWLEEERAWGGWVVPESSASSLDFIFFSP